MRYTILKTNTLQKVQNKAVILAVFLILEANWWEFRRQEDIHRELGLEALNVRLHLRANAVWQSTALMQDPLMGLMDTLLTNLDHNHYRDRWAFPRSLKRALGLGTRTASEAGGDPHQYTPEHDNQYYSGPYL